MKDKTYEIPLNMIWKRIGKYKFFGKKVGWDVNVNKVLAQVIRKPMTKNLKDEKNIQGLHITFGQQIYLKWDQYLLLIMVLNINCVW